MLKLGQIFSTLLCLCAGLSFPSNVYAQDSLWYEILNGEDIKIGHAERTVIETPDTIEIVNTRLLSGKDNEGRYRASKTKVIESKTPSGDTKRLTLLTGSGRRLSSTIVELEGSSANIKRKTKYGEQSYSLSLPENIRFDFGESLLKTIIEKDRSSLEFDNFNIISLRPERVIIEAVTSPETQTSTLVRKSYDGDALRSVAFLELGDKGQLLKVSQPTFNAPIVRKLSDERSAKRKSRSQKPRDIIALKAPYKISQKALAGKIRYIFSYKYGIEFNIPETSEQRVLKKGNFVALDICDACGNMAPLSDKQKSAFLAPSPWIQSDDPKILKTAKSVAKKSLSEHETMIMLGKRARRRLKTVNFSGHYSASEAWKRRAGDCTEDAVTLAALGRAAGIPTRIVSGLVYSRARYHGVSNVFVTHSWTQAWYEGKWHNHDISMGGFDAGHIVLAKGEGDPAMISSGHQLGSLLKLEKMAEIKVSDDYRNLTFGLDGL